jgi:hypothetical protein
LLCELIVVNVFGGGWEVYARLARVAESDSINHKLAVVETRMTFTF